jgi:endoglucanase
MSLPSVLRDLLSLPTAAFVETAVQEYVRSACATLPGVTSTMDRYGNILARYRHGPRDVCALVFTAHMDHPGFCALRMDGERSLLAASRGWVEPEYFAGAGVRFWSNGECVAGTVREITKAAPIFGMIGRTGRPEEVRVDVAGPVAPQSPGMWDLPEPTLADGRVVARGCDDIAGCAAMLALLQRLSTARASADVYCLFTRAEEVGFIGAIGAARERTIPVGLPVIAIETSKELPGAAMGAGPILRVGDKSSVFTPAVTAFCERAAKQHAAKCKEAGREFRYQRKLMDGGTCESTAYMTYGYPTTGMCVALGNYHNMDVQRGRIASEYISLSDWEFMVDWFEALVLDEQGYGGEGTAMRAQLDKRFEEYLPLLEAASQPA